MRRITPSPFLPSILVAMLAAGHAAAQAPHVLEAPRAAATVAPPAHATRPRTVGVDFAALAALDDHATFVLDLLDGPAEARVVRRRDQVAGFTLAGDFIGLPHGRFVLTVVNEAVVGYFFLGGDRKTQILRYGGPEGVHVLHGIDGMRLAPCSAVGFDDRDAQQQLEDLLAQIGVLPPDDGDLARTTAPGGEPIGSCPPLPPTFDIMVAYSANARMAAGGTDAIQAIAITAVEIAQLSYQNCGANILTNTVALVEVNYTESGDFSTDLDRLRDPDDGYFDFVHGERNVAQADFVSMLLVSDEGGLGTCMADEDDAFSVVRWAQAVDGLTLPHEVGHNIGLAHNPEDADCEPTENGYGHNFWVPALADYKRTLMAYKVFGEEERLPFYSDPGCHYYDVATGTPTRNNQAVIMDRRFTCEDFRRTRIDVWVDFAHGGSETGLHDEPFNTLIEGVTRTLPDPVVEIPVLHIKPGSSNETITISKPMILDACGGPVTIG